MTASSSIKIRLHLDDQVALGPGKADLLEAIQLHGSISAAGKTMKMSYKRAWDLVNVMNNSFTKPLVSTSKGGAQGGGAQLTPFGENILIQYRAIEQKASAAVVSDLQRLSQTLHKN